MITSLDPKDHDIIALQELWLDHLGRTRASRHWTVVYPTLHLDKPGSTCSLMLINKNLPTDSWTDIETGSQDITAIRLQHGNGYLDIFNIYNDCNHSRSLSALEKTLQRLSELRSSRHANTHNTDEPQHHAMWLGDFNRHHPLWDEERNHHLFTRSNLDKAQTLIDLLTTYDMRMILPKGLPTLEALALKNYTRPDNVFCTDELEGAVTQCMTLPEQHPVCTDHIPVLTTLDLQVLQNNPPHVTTSELPTGKNLKRC